jgi:hypothetical protein
MDKLFLSEEEMEKLYKSFLNSEEIQGEYFINNEEINEDYKTLEYLLESFEDISSLGNSIKVGMMKKIKNTMNLSRNEIFDLTNSIFYKYFYDLKLSNIMEKQIQEFNKLDN